MRSRTTPQFRALLSALPERVQRQAREAYTLFVANQQHPGLRFKRVRDEPPIYSARVGISYRALAILDGSDLIWFWIGSHADYDKRISEL